MDPNLEIVSLVRLPLRAPPPLISGERNVGQGLFHRRNADIYFTLLILTFINVRICSGEVGGLGGGALATNNCGLSTFFFQGTIEMSRS